MEPAKPSVAVLGSGSWGTALASLIARNGHAHHVVTGSPMQKIYWGLVHGQMPEAQGLIDAPIRRDPDSLTQPAGGAEDADYSAAGLPWGAKDAPFDTVAELEQVMGMRPALFASAERYLTVFTGNPMPSAASADDIVLQAMGVDRAPPAPCGDQ